MSLSKQSDADATLSGLNATITGVNLICEKPAHTRDSAVYSWGSGISVLVSDSTVNTEGDCGITVQSAANTNVIVDNCEINVNGNVDDISSGAFYFLSYGTDFEPAGLSVKNSKVYSELSGVFYAYNANIYIEDSLLCSKEARHAYYIKGLANTYTIDNSALFSYGSKIFTTDYNDNDAVMYVSPANAFNAPINDGVIIAWDAEAAFESGMFVEGADVDNILTIPETGVTAKWAVEDIDGTLVSGMNYSYGGNSGFIPLTDILVGQPGPSAAELGLAIPQDTSYDGNSHGVTGIPNTTFGTVAVSYYSAGYPKSSSAPVNAGTYSVLADIVGGEQDYSNVIIGILKIAPRTLQVTASAENKVYDGTTATAVTLTPENLVGTDTVTVSASGAFSDANAGTGKIVTVSDIILAGADAVNYAAPVTVSGVTADITKAPAPTGINRTISAAESTEKEYSFDLTSLLPYAAGTFGAVNYTPVITANTNNILAALEYTSGNILKIPILAVSEGLTAQITVTVSSTNYEDFDAVISISTVDTVPESNTYYISADGSDTVLAFSGGWTADKVFGGEGCLTVSAEGIITVSADAEPFYAIAKLRKNDSVKYVSIEKPVDTGIFDGKTWHIPASQTGNANMVMLGWEISDIWTTNDVELECTDTMITVPPETGAFKAIVKLKNGTAVKYIGIEKDTYVDVVGYASGYVTDAKTGEPIEGAIVTLYNGIGTSSPTGTTVQTDDFGYYAFDGVVVGNYTIDVVKDGYENKLLSIVVTENGSDNQKLSLTTAITPARVVVSPETTSLTIPVVSSAPSTQQFTATVYDQNNVEITGATVTWNVTDTAGVSISPSGVLTVTSSASQGILTITATSGDVSGTVSVTVAAASEGKVKVYYLRPFGSTVTAKQNTELYPSTPVYELTNNASDTSLSGDVMFTISLFFEQNIYSDNSGVNSVFAASSGVFIVTRDSDNQQLIWDIYDNPNLLVKDIRTPVQSTLDPGTYTVTIDLSKIYTVNGEAGSGVLTYRFTVLESYDGILPKTPTLANRTADSVTLNTLSVTGQEIEYGIANSNNPYGAIWQDSPSFTGLNEANTYYFFARVKAASGVAASGATNVLTVDMSTESPFGK